MCRGKDFCYELGYVSSYWSKETLLPRPDWFDSQIDLFIEAVNSFQLGDRDSCLKIISQIRSDEIIDWYVEHGQMSGRQRALIIGLEKPQDLPINLRDPERSTKKLDSIVFQRDKYRCRYCGSRLIPTRFIKKFAMELDSPVFRNGRTNQERHGIIHLTKPVADHVVPWRLGGRTTLDNLVSSCPPCNYGKDGYTLEQLGMDDPFSRPNAGNDWICRTSFL